MPTRVLRNPERHPGATVTFDWFGWSNNVYVQTADAAVTGPVVVLDREDFDQLVREYAEARGYLFIADPGLNQRGKGRQAPVAAPAEEF